MNESAATPVRKARGRPRKQLTESVREAVRNPTGNVTVQGRDGEILTRSRKQGLDKFDVPLSFIPHGWTYQWNTVSVTGNREVVSQMNVEFHQNGWRPVPAARHDGHWMPRGHTGSILVDGMELNERPKELTEEAQAEQEYLARQQMRDRDAALMGGAAAARQAMRGGFEMGGKYRGTGGDIKVSVDPGLDIAKPSYPLAED